MEIAIRFRGEVAVPTLLQKRVAPRIFATHKLRQRPVRTNNILRVIPEYVQRILRTPRGNIQWVRRKESA